MFKKSFPKKDRVNKITKPSKRSFRDDAKQKLREQLLQAQLSPSTGSPQLNSAIITVIVGEDARLFAVHEHVLNKSPVLRAELNSRFSQNTAGHLALRKENPETFSAVLQWLYKDDYYPRLFKDRDGRVYELEDIQDGLSPHTDGGHSVTASPTIYHERARGHILRDTAVYCAAAEYELPKLKELALKKQGFQSGIDVATILRSARFAYENTKDTDIALRAHYLALIVRSRKTFMRSGTMQKEIEAGGKVFFDLFVALCNHLDDVSDAGSARSSPYILQR